MGACVLNMETKQSWTEDNIVACDKLADCFAILLGVCDTQE